MKHLVKQDSIARKIWGKADTVLFIFAGAAHFVTTDKNLHSIKDKLLRGNYNVLIHVPYGDFFFGDECIGSVFYG